MSKVSPHHPDKKARAVAAYKQLLEEAVPTYNCGKRGIVAMPRAEMQELARAYGTTSETLKNWAKQAENSVK